MILSDTFLFTSDCFVLNLLLECRMVRCGFSNLKNDVITTSIYVIVSINLYLDVKSNKYVLLYKFSGLILKGFDVIKWNARGAFALKKPNTCKPCLDRIVS